MSVMPRITAKIDFQVHCLYMVMLLSLPPPLRVCLLASEAVLLIFLVGIAPDLVVMA